VGRLANGTKHTGRFNVPQIGIAEWVKKVVELGNLRQNVVM
jgi:hypothetical protein